MLPSTAMTVPPWRRSVSWLSAFAAAAVLLLAACGGGVGTQGTGTGPSAFSQGPVSGFGSIVVNGTHFDETSALVVDDRGHAVDRTSFRLGQTVQIDSGQIVGGSAKAQAIHVTSDLVGPVTAAYDAASGYLGVLGQSVKVVAPSAQLAGTALDGLPGGVARLAPGDVVEVSALFDGVTGVYVATRIDAAAGASAFKARGVVANLDAAAHTFAFAGAQSFDYTGVAPPTGLANGQSVLVFLATARDGAGRYPVSSFGASVRKPADGEQVEIKGVVDAGGSATAFSVAGVSVDASGATVTPAGAGVVAGARVEVEGTMVGSTLVATQVAVEAESDDDHGEGGGGGPISVDGTVSALDTAHQTFVVLGRGVTVDYATATFSGGTVDHLADGRKVEIRGVLSSDGTVLVASSILFDN